ncbi:MAG TPA: methionyl-tRNA formyltransferase, partial [Patescibacteria group bacterium]|nr:methionyl-tRNA formyltransferase [Patescibacteria group bacterium]
TDTFESLASKLAELSADLLIDLLPKYQSGEIIPVAQNINEATFTKIIKKEDGKIDWSKPAQEIYNMWRAYTPWPGIWTTYKGENFKILECKILDGNLELIKVQPAGKNPMLMKDFLNGNKDFQLSDLGK